MLKHKVTNIVKSLILITILVFSIIVLKCNISALSSKNDDISFINKEFFDTKKEDKKVINSFLIKLGFDINGGSQIIFSINFEEFIKSKYNYLINDIKYEIEKNMGLFIKPRVDIQKRSIVIEKNLDKKQKQELIKTIKNIDYNLTVAYTDEEVEVFYDQSNANELLHNTIEQTMQVIRKRIDSLGTKEISLQKIGNSLIMLQVPSSENIEKIKKLVGKTAKLSFHLVNENTPFVFEESSQPDDSMLVPMLPRGESKYKGYYKLYKEELLDGSYLQDARVDYSDLQPGIAFKLNKVGASKFANITSFNKGRTMAIVLDNKVLMAPTINDPILDGNGKITGNFDKEDANEFAKLLKSGALPVPLEIVEQRTIGASLGSDAIHSIKMAGIVGISAIILFMAIYYKMFGVISGIALIFNLSLTITIIAVFGITVTLPGIAAIILALGMSIDTNVLIYEKIREIIKDGTKLNIVNSKKDKMILINEGFKGAMSAILDSNFTTIVATITLLAVNSGFIRGFAIGLIIGLLCSLFTAITLTKLLIEFWSIKLNRKISV
jgi:preprotein translocase subunit SecD